jgi:hypothetical protein
MEVSGQLHTTAALTLVKKKKKLLYKRLGGTHCYGGEKKTSVLTHLACSLDEGFT